MKNAPQEAFAHVYAHMLRHVGSSVSWTNGAVRVSAYLRADGVVFGSVEELSEGGAIKPFTYSSLSDFCRINMPASTSEWPVAPVPLEPIENVIEEVLTIYPRARKSGFTYTSASVQTIAHVTRGASGSVLIDLYSTVTKDLVKSIYAENIDQLAATFGKPKRHLSDVEASTVAKCAEAFECSGANNINVIFPTCEVRLSKQAIGPPPPPPMGAFGRNQRICQKQQARNVCGACRVRAGLRYKPLV